MFINIANSITVINITGIDIDLNITNINKKIIAIDTVFTLLKSWSLTWIKSFIRGPSPASIALGSDLSFDLE